VQMSEIATAGRDVLLATKLHVPTARPGLVPRPRLAGRLQDGVALVCAPAGYGKTVLLAEWVRSRPRPSGWLSLDAADNDPARFWRHTVAALDEAGLEVGEQIGPLLGPSAPPSFQNLVTALINELATDEAVLILDDYHVIKSASVHESVGFLIEHRPAGLSLVLASRTDPPLPLARIRAAGQLAELRAADLRFTAGEAAELLQQAVPALPEASAAALAGKTEGWAAGLQLAALSLRGRNDTAAFVAAFTGSHRYILDFLTEEVLERQPQDLRNFLLQTSVLDRLSGSLCDAVTGRAGSQAQLERAERAGLFLVPLDETRRWWRYHHLFADLLRARLREEQPSHEARLHRDAAAWYEQHALPDDAIRHAVAAGETTWAARMIEEHFDVVYYQRGEAATIAAWLAALPDDLVRGRPRLLLAQAQMAAASGRVADVERAAAAAERTAAAADTESFEPTVGRAVSMLVNVPGQVALERSYLAQLRGDAQATAAFAEQVLARSTAEEWLLTSTARGFLAVAEWLHGRLHAAEAAFCDRIAQWRAAGQATLAAWGSYQLAQVQRAGGRLEAARLTGEQALEAVGGGAPGPASGPAFMSLAEVAYQRNDLDLARRLATEGIALCRQFVYTPPLAAGLVTLAWIRQAAHDPAGARAAMAEAARISPVPPGLLNPVPAQQARLLLAQGDLAAAERWADECGLGLDDQAAYPREAGHLLLARVLLARTQPGPALALLARLQETAAAQHRTGSLIEIGALRALALAASDEGPAAVTALAEALALAGPPDYVRVFADEGLPMARLLRRVVAAQRDCPAAAAIPFGYLAGLQQAFGRGPAAVSATQPGLVDPLTGREAEVLNLLAAGRSNQAIAAELVVSLDTIKKHVGHVLAKLGAANRTEAVARARELDLIG